MRWGNGPAPGCSHWMEFGTADGLRSRETATNSHPSAWRSRDGHLWFATPKGLVEVDPAHFPVNTLPPPVALERFRWTMSTQPLQEPGSWLKVQAGHVHFEFDYAGLSFVAPQKVRYRYMLEGFDHGWTEAGTRRTAYYTNIPPGRYTFRVQAANNDGLWNTAGAALSFDLRPHFYQTVVVLRAAAGSRGGSSCAAAAAAAAPGRARVPRGAGRAQPDRARDSRHAGAGLRGRIGPVRGSVGACCASTRWKMRPSNSTQTREYVRDGLADARQSIWALRTQDANETTLPVKLRRMAEAAGGEGLDAPVQSFWRLSPATGGNRAGIAARGAGGHP